MGDNIKKTYSVRDNVEMTDIRVEMTDEGLSRALFVGKMGNEKGISWQSLDDSVGFGFEFDLLDSHRLTLPLSACY